MQRVGVSGWGQILPGCCTATTQSCLCSNPAPGLAAGRVLVGAGRCLCPTRYQRLGHEFAHGGITTQKWPRGRIQPRHHPQPCSPSPDTTEALPGNRGSSPQSCMGKT